jgi:hypothetical protein
MVPKHFHALDRSKLGSLWVALATVLGFFALFFQPTLSLAETTGVRWLTIDEFQQLSEELSHKVNLFDDVWKADPEAEFYGGTSRDFSYWVKGQFKNTSSREIALNKAKELRRVPIIHVREFIGLDSDIDIITKSNIKIMAQDYGIKSKIDTRLPNLFTPETPEGQNEILQGHIPVEKIRLSSKGYVRKGVLGDGLREIYEGKITVHFSSPEDFAKSEYAKKGINHPILLALRFIRLQAVNYFQEYGSDYPNLKKLFDLDPTSEQQVDRVIKEALDGKTLLPYLDNPSFESWLNGTIQKAFRSHTNPTAAMELMKKFGADALPLIYDKVEPINQYLFAKKWNEHEAEVNLEAFGFTPQQLFKKVESYFPDLTV